MWWIVFVSLFILTQQEEIPPRVNITEGTIEGRIVKNNQTQVEYYAFQGIPFAKPPVGELRFQSPQKPEKFNGTKETKAFKEQCLQERGGSEDCLYLNIFTKNLDTKTLKPVMVFIHPGRFYDGDVFMTSPDFLIEEDVILVTPAYRLYVFGFLSIQNTSAEGNAGLKDQVAALQWIKDNIKQFGGDPNKVTIFGTSAGSASIQYLSLSPLARGLFQRAIMVSGSSLNEWAFQPNPLERALQLGRCLKFENEKNDTQELVEFLKKVDAKNLQMATNFDCMGKPEGASIYHFAPTVERNHSGAFITKSPYQLLEENQSANVPYIIGYSKGEGNMILPSKFLDIKVNFIDDEELKEYPKNNEKLVPKTMNLERGSSKSKEAMKGIKNFFFKDGDLENTTNFLKFEEQYMFVKGIRKSVESLRKSNDVYFFKNNYKAGGHSSELRFFFPMMDLDKEDKILSKKLVRMWTNFAKTGNPTPSADPVLENFQWTKVSPENDVAYLNIGKELTMDKNVDQEYYDFWINLYQKYGQPPFYAF